MLRALLVAVASVLAAATPGAAKGPIAHLESGDFGEFSQPGALNGQLFASSGRSYDGRRSARATYCGGGSNGFARGVFRVSWPPGSDIWYGTAFFLPSGFKGAMGGEVDLLRWDDFGRSGDSGEFGGVVMFAADHRARLVRGFYGDAESEVISKTFALPTGRWFWLEVHQRFIEHVEDGEPISEVFIDGHKVLSTNAPNSYGAVIDRLRVGLVAIQEDRQEEPLRLWFDRSGYSRDRIGPRGSTKSALPRSQRRSGTRARTLGKKCG